MGTAEAIRCRDGACPVSERPTVVLTVNGLYKLLPLTVATPAGNANSKEIRVSNSVLGEPRFDKEGRFSSERIFSKPAANLPMSERSRKMDPAGGNYFGDDAYLFARLCRTRR